MNGWNTLIAALDTTFGLANTISSKVNKLAQSFDNDTQEHVIWFEYRIKVRNAWPPKPECSLVDIDTNDEMALMRELLDQADRPGPAT